MALLDQTSFEPLLKVLYPSDVIKNMAYINQPFLALVPKDESFEGESRKEPVIFADSQNRSAVAATAFTASSSVQSKAFIITRVSNYGSASISNETILASRSDAGAFTRALKTATDSAINSVSRAIGMQLYRGGTGTVGQIDAAANVGSATVAVQLATPADAMNLAVGMSIALSATDGGAARSGTAFIVKLDPIAGTFLCSATFGGAAATLSSLISGAAVSDYIYANAGDVNATISGLNAWLPGSSTGLSDSFFSVNRSADKARLAGIQYDGSALSIEEALQKAASLVATIGGQPSHVFMNYADYYNLSVSLGSKQVLAQFTKEMVDEPKASIGFNALQLIGPHGPLKVIPDVNCPKGKAYVLQLDTWKLSSLGESVRLFDTDGRTLLRDAGDSVSLRIFSYAQLSCRAPGYNAVVTLPS